MRGELLPSIHQVIEEVIILKIVCLLKGNDARGKIRLFLNLVKWKPFNRQDMKIFPEYPKLKNTSSGVGGR